MKVLLIKDVYKLGHAGDVKKVATGFGRNYLIPQGLAVIATPGALKQADRIRKDAAVQRAALNEEMSGFAEQLAEKTLTFPARASETGKLYGSVTTRMIAEALVEDTGVEISHRQVDTQPLRMLGEHHVGVRLTVDLVPLVRVIVHREGESPEAALAEVAALAEAEEAAAMEAGEAAPEAAADDDIAAELAAEMPLGEEVEAVEGVPAADDESLLDTESAVDTLAESDSLPDLEAPADEPEPVEAAEPPGEEIQASAAEDELESEELDDTLETT